ncbi:MAG: hypothetical protein MHPSP_001793 [Paramarteilia canceri]
MSETDKISVLDLFEALRKDLNEPVAAEGKLFADKVICFFYVINFKLQKYYFPDLGQEHETKLITFFDKIKGIVELEGFVGLMDDLHACLGLEKEENFNSLQKMVKTACQPVTFNDITEDILNFIDEFLDYSVLKVNTECFSRENRLNALQALFLEFQGLFDINGELNQTTTNKSIEYLNHQFDMNIPSDKQTVSKLYNLYKISLYSENDENNLKPIEIADEKMKISFLDALFDLREKIIGEIPTDVDCEFKTIRPFIIEYINTSQNSSSMRFIYRENSNATMDYLVVKINQFSHVQLTRKVKENHRSLLKKLATNHDDNTEGVIDGDFDKDPKPEDNGSVKLKFVCDEDGFFEEVSQTFTDLIMPDDAKTLKKFCSQAVDCIKNSDETQISGQTLYNCANKIKPNDSKFEYTWEVILMLAVIGLLTIALLITCVAMCVAKSS